MRLTSQGKMKALGLFLFCVFQASAFADPLYPCQPPCGVNADCKTTPNTSTSACVCNDGYFGDPYNGCFRSCTKDTDCLSTKACYYDQCIDPCKTYYCAHNAQCDVINHQPKCSCSEGFTGDPSSQCNKIEGTTQSFTLPDQNRLSSSSNARNTTPPPQAPGHDDKRLSDKRDGLNTSIIGHKPALFLGDNKEVTTSGMSTRGNKTGQHPGHNGGGNTNPHTPTIEQNRSQSPGHSDGQTTPRTLTGEYHNDHISEHPNVYPKVGPMSPTWNSGQGKGGGLNGLTGKPLDHSTTGQDNRRHHGHNDSNSTREQNGDNRAKVTLNLAMNLKGGQYKCKKPREDLEIFRNCISADDKLLSQVTCQCSKCNETLLLLNCINEVWYPSHTGICTSSSCLRGESKKTKNIVLIVIIIVIVVAVSLCVVISCCIYVKRKRRRTVPTLNVPTINVSDVPDVEQASQSYNPNRLTVQSTSLARSESCVRQMLAGQDESEFDEIALYDDTRGEWKYIKRASTECQQESTEGMASKRESIDGILVSCDNKE